jgi:integrase
MTAQKSTNKVKLTVGRIEKFECETGKEQSFLWCDEVAGLGVRATAGSKEKRYIFQTKVNKKSMRLTIGKVSAWTIPQAQQMARDYQVMIDKGSDPRKVKADREAAKLIEAAEKEKRERLESVTVGIAWNEYTGERKQFWSELHYNDHIKVMHPGGEKRTRSKLLTQPGILNPLSSIRLVDVTPELIDEWAKREALKRPTQARLALRLFRAFLFWCARHQIYKNIVKSNSAKSKNAKEYLGKPKLKNDVLQREQLPAWFSAVTQLSNSIISAYLQALLLTGARREELASLRWCDVDFKWNSLTIRDKVDGQRVIPLTPYVTNLLSALPRRNEWVFSSSTSSSGRLADPRIAHNRACAIAGLELTLHGLRRSFASLCEWTETPSGIAAQIQGHKPQGVREKNYIRRPLDLLRKWHVKIEEWILKQAKIEFTPEKTGLRVVASS